MFVCSWLALARCYDGEHREFPGDLTIVLYSNMFTVIEEWHCSLSFVTLWIGFAECRLKAVIILTTVVPEVKSSSHVIPPRCAFS